MYILIKRCIENIYLPYMIHITAVYGYHPILPDWGLAVKVRHRATCYPGPPGPGRRRKEEWRISSHGEYDSYKVYWNLRDIDVSWSLSNGLLGIPGPLSPNGQLHPLADTSYYSISSPPATGNGPLYM